MKIASKNGKMFIIHSHRYSVLFDTHYFSLYCPDFFENGEALELENLDMETPDYNDFLNSLRDGGDPRSFYIHKEQHIPRST